MSEEEEQEKEQGDKILRHQLEFYKKNILRIHVKRKDGRYYNGIVLEVQGDMLILEDRVLGAMPIHFLEIDHVEKFTEAEK